MKEAVSIPVIANGDIKDYDKKLSKRGFRIYKKQMEL